MSLRLARIVMQEQQLRLSKHSLKRSKLFVIRLLERLRKTSPSTLVQVHIRFQCPSSSQPKTQARMVSRSNGLGPVRPYQVGSRSPTGQRDQIVFTPRTF